MAFIIQDTEEISKLTQKIVKTDEVLNLVRIKHKELAKVEKRYHKLLEQNFQLKTEYKILNDRVKDCTEKHTPLQHEIREWKDNFKTLQNTYHEYVNKQQLKYQEACQRIRDLEKRDAKKNNKHLADEIDDLSLQLELTQSEMQTKESSFKSEKMALTKDFNKQIQELNSNVDDLQLQLELTRSELEIKTNNYASEKHAATDDLKNKIKSLDSKILDLQRQLKITHSDLDINKRNYSSEKMKLITDFQQKINSLNYVLQTMNGEKRKTTETRSITIQTDFSPITTESSKEVTKYSNISTQTVYEAEKADVQPTVVSTAAKIFNSIPKISSTLSTQTDSQVLQTESTSDKHFSFATKMAVDIQPKSTDNIINVAEDQLILYSTLSTQTEFEPENLAEKRVSNTTFDLPTEMVQKLVNTNISTVAIEGELGLPVSGQMPLHSIEEELPPIFSSKNPKNPIGDHSPPIPLPNYSIQAELNSLISSPIDRTAEQLPSTIPPEGFVNTIEKQCLSSVNIIDDLPIRTSEIESENNLPVLSQLKEDIDVSDILARMRDVPYLVSPLSFSHDSNSLCEEELFPRQFQSPLKILDNIEINDKVKKDFNFSPSSSFNLSNPLFKFKNTQNTSMWFKSNWRSKYNSKITKKYKGTKNKLLETIKTAKLDIKEFLQSYIIDQEKPIFIVSPRIIKSDIMDMNSTNRCKHFSNTCCNSVPPHHQSLCSCYNISNFHKPCCSYHNIPCRVNFCNNNCVHMANECHKCSVKKSTKRHFGALDDSDTEDELMQKIMKRCRKIVKQTINNKDDGLLNINNILKEESISSGDYELDRNKRGSTIAPNLEKQNKKTYATNNNLRNINLEDKISQANSSTANNELNSNITIPANPKESISFGDYELDRNKRGSTIAPNLEKRNTKTFATNNNLRNINLEDKISKGNSSTANYELNSNKTIPANPKESISSGDYKVDRNKRGSTIAPNLEQQNNTNTYAINNNLPNINLEAKISENSSTVNYELNSNKTISINPEERNTADCVINKRMEASNVSHEKNTFEIVDNTNDDVNISEVCDTNNLRKNTYSNKPKQGCTKLQKLLRIRRNLRSNNKPVIKPKEISIENNLSKTVEMSSNKRDNIASKKCLKRKISSSNIENFKREESFLFGSQSESESESDCNVEEITTKKTRVSKLTLNPLSVQRNIVSKNTSLHGNPTSVVNDKPNESVIKRVLRKDVKNTFDGLADNADISVCSNSSSVIEKRESLRPQENEKVFKRPQKSKLSIPLCPKSPELQTIDRYIPPKTIPLELQDDKTHIGTAMTMVSDFANLQMGCTELLKHTIQYLSSFEAKLVAKLIIEQAATDFCQVYDKRYSPPAPLLTTTQQKLILLLDELEKNGVTNLRSTFLKLIQMRILHEKLIEVVHPLTRMYVAVSKLAYQIKDVRSFCCSAALCMGDLFVPVMFIILTIWGDVLPMASAGDDNPMATVLIQAIQNKSCNLPGYNFSNLINMLSNYYGYKNGAKSNDEVMEYLVTLYKAKPTEILFVSIETLCKNVQGKWPVTQVKKYLIPIVENGNDSSESKCLVRMTLHLISKLHQQFITADKDKEAIRVISVWLQSHKIHY